MVRSIGLTAALVLVLVGLAPSAQAYTPKNNTVTFNNAKKASGKYTLIYELDRAINAAPKGSTITMAMYLFDRPTTATALVKAHQRGVNVQVLLDNGEVRPQAMRVRKELGGNWRTGKSFVKSCSNSCMSSLPAGVMHAKYYLFSQSGTAKNVSMVSSGNPAYTNSASSWNNNQTKTNNATIYASLRKYFTDSIQGIDRPNYYRTTTSGDWKLYFFPKALVKGQNVSPMLDVLNHVKCTGVKKGYGSGGKTVVRVGMWGWTSARNDLARRLWTLKNNGCKVDVVINTGRMSKSTMQILLRGTRHGQIKVYDAWHDGNRNDKASLYQHNKVTMINGRWFGSKGTKVVYTGSQNWTSLGTYVNNDILLRIRSNSVYNAYSKNQSYIRDHASKRVYVTPRVMNPAVSTGGNADGRMAAPGLGYTPPVGDSGLEDESWQFDPEG